jgi:hypothetical protein
VLERVALERALLGRALLVQAVPEQALLERRAVLNKQCAELMAGTGASEEKP